MSPRCSDARWGGSRVRRETPTRQKLRDGMLTAHVGHGHGTAWHSPSHLPGRMHVASWLHPRFKARDTSDLPSLRRAAGVSSEE